MITPPDLRSNFGGKNKLHPDYFPNDAAIVVPTMQMSCVVCGDELISLWDVQCCRPCLRQACKDENAKGWSSKKKFEEYDIRPGSLLRVWWRGDTDTVFLRLVIAKGLDGNDPWIIVVDPASGLTSCWSSHSISLSVSPLLKNGQLAIQQIL
jgi:hypothetical protein